MLGGGLAQLPMGRLADKFDRRHVLIGPSIASTLACAITIGLAGSGVTTVFLAAGLFGATTMPIYSVSAAHADDFATSAERVELSAALIFLYAVGAIASPIIASVLIGWFGPAAMFVFIALAHVALVIFGLIRDAGAAQPRRPHPLCRHAPHLVPGRPPVPPQPREWRRRSAVGAAQSGDIGRAARRQRQRFQKPRQRLGVQCRGTDNGQPDVMESRRIRACRVQSESEFAPGTGQIPMSLSMIKPDTL